MSEYPSPPTPARPDRNHPDHGARPAEPDEKAKPGQFPTGLEVYGWIFFVIAVLASLLGLWFAARAVALTYSRPQYAAALIASIAYTANAVYGCLVGFRLGRGHRTALKHARINLISAGVIGFALGATRAIAAGPTTEGFTPAVNLIYLFLMYQWGGRYWNALTKLSGMAQAPDGRWWSADGEWWWDGQRWQPRGPAHREDREAERPTA